MPVFTFLLTVLTIIIMDVLKLTNFFLVKSNPYWLINLLVVGIFVMYCFNKMNWKRNAE